MGWAVWATFGLLGLALVGYLLALVLEPGATTPLNSWHVGIEIVASGLCIARGSGRDRRSAAALLLGLACLSWTLGDVLLTLQAAGAGAALTWLVNVFYVGFYPLALVSVLLFTSVAIKRRSDAPDWLDGAIASLGMAGVCAAFAFRSLEHLFATGTFLDLAFPLGDLLLLGIVAGSTIVVDAAGRGTLVLLALGMAIDSAGDTLSFVGDWAHVAPVVYGLAWPAAIWVFAMAMWHGRAGMRRPSWGPGFAFVLPWIVTTASLGIVVSGSWYHFGPIAVGLATATLIFAGARLAFRPALYLARERLRSTEERYRVMFELNPQPMMLYDRETAEIVAVSDALVVKYGYARAEVEAAGVEQLLPGEAASTAAYSAGAQGADRVEFEDRHQRRDGAIIDVEVTITELELDGRRCGLAHLHDVTERNRVAAEAALARDQAVEASNLKSAFLANVSHEIRTPMNGVIGMIDLLLDMGLSAEQRECAQQVARSGEQALAIINDILDISKIETGHIELDLDDFDLHQAVADTCAPARMRAQTKGVQFELTLDAAVPRHVHGDARRFEQVLQNLVDNAVKFTPAGNITVAVTRPGPQEDVVRVEVRDTGIGIDPAKLARMFEPFTQADVSTTRLYGGTGLGLAIARELAALMGATISAASTPGRGSTFSFDVNLAPPQSAATPSPVTQSGSAPQGLWSGSPLVLIAEDSQINQIVAARALERCGCRTHLAGDGEAALDMLALHGYDAVLMDCQMPQLDGYAATRELRRRERGSGRHTPVIAMTAHAMEPDRQRCLDAGMDDYITKPMRYDELVEVLRRWIATGPDASTRPAEEDRNLRAAG